jgi:hypothetical protein
MINLYDKNGWLDCESIIAAGYPFTFIIGARGIGKTYGILKYILEHKIRHILLRRTQVESEIISKPEFHPYKSVCRDMGLEITTASVVKNVAGVYSLDDPDDLLGYIAALSTFANLRGFDTSDVDLVYLDEFIPEEGKTPIKAEFEKYLNMYETVNRNRELTGRQPVRAICTANSNTIDNPYFLGLGIVNKIYAMQRKGKSIYADDKRGLLVISLSGSPISEAKADTALYRLASGTGYADMALNNIYSGTDDSRISNRERMIEYRAMVTVGEITIYKHKSDLRYYVSTHRQGGAGSYTAGTDDLLRFKSKYHMLLATAYLEDRVIFEDAISQLLFKKYLIG